MTGADLSRSITDEMSLQRQRMIDRLRGHYGIIDERVLVTMLKIPRQRFVPEAIRSQAYTDNALPISSGQTISQPFIVARMTELLDLRADDVVLEIGSGSGYQTAVLASLVSRVFGIERLSHLTETAEKVLFSLGFENFVIRTGDGTLGWPEKAPFDKILAAAGGPKIPRGLIDQLKTGGILVMPVGDLKGEQRLYRVTKLEIGERVEDHGPCAFVPLIGRHGWADRNAS